MTNIDLKKLSKDYHVKYLYLNTKTGDLDMQLTKKEETSIFQKKFLLFEDVAFFLHLLKNSHKVAFSLDFDGN